MLRGVVAVVLTGGLAAFTVPATTAVADQAGTELVSQVGGTAGNVDSLRPAITPDGTWVVFQTEATDLVPFDTNAAWDIVRAGVGTGSLQRVSIGHDGQQGDAASTAPDISADGTRVAFESLATNLLPPRQVVVIDMMGDFELIEVPADDNDVQDIFVRDTAAGTTVRASTRSDGSEAGTLGDTHSEPAISGDGRFVAFTSTADDLVAGDTNGVSDVFVKDLASRTTTRVSVASGGGQATGESRRPDISHDGRYVTFESDAADLVAGDGNGVTDVFVHDRQTATTARVSVDSTGAEGTSGATRPTVSASGRYVAFESLSPLDPADTNAQVDVYRADRLTGTVTRESIGDDGTELTVPSTRPSISADGRSIAFHTTSPTLAPGIGAGVTAAVVRDVLGGRTELVSVSAAGTPSAGSAVFTTVVADGGRRAAFTTDGADLGPPDGNGLLDVYVRHLGPPPAGYWILESDGDVHAFGDVPDLGGVTADLVGGETAIAITARPGGQAYWVLTDQGRVLARGPGTSLPGPDPAGPPVAVVDLTSLTEPGEVVTALAATPDGTGLWVFTSAGRVVAFGTAPAPTELAGAELVLALDLDGPVVDSVATPDGLGAYLVAADGGVFAVGSATFVDSVRGALTTLYGPPGFPAQPIVGIAADPDGAGYWVVGADGGVFSFDAPFRGSLPAIVAFDDLVAPVGGVVPYGQGYLLVAGDGGLFAFSDIPFAGSAAGVVDSPVTDVAASS